MKLYCAPRRINIQRQGFRAKGETMILRMNGPLRIDNLRHYPSGTVEKLRNMLMAGALVTPDPHRKNFYDLDAEESIFYIHVSPTGTVLLLACWRKTPAHQGIPQESPVREAVACC